MLRVTNLRCEQTTTPLGIDSRKPRLSWQLESDRRGARQTAYRITVAGTPEELSAGQTIWDTGQLDSDSSVLVPYAGQPLRSRQRVWWQVEIWDEAGRRAVSEPSWWEIGLLNRTDWRATWIGSDMVGGRWTTSPSPLLRHSFSLSKPIASARLYITALGVYECAINGRRVGHDLLAPGWTDYHTRVHYQTYDVADLLHDGENVIGAMLGDGWYCGHIAWLGRQCYGDRPQLLAQLEVTHADGSVSRVSSDRQWRFASGPILESDFLMGESYDARRVQPGWDAPGFDARSWRPVELFAHPDLQLTAQSGPTVRRQEELRPVAPPRKTGAWPGGSWIVDLGQNMVGWVRLKVDGPAGHTIKLRYAEVLNADGSLYTTNLRGARSIDHYTLCGGGPEVYESHFTFHGFRYVELIDFPGTATIETLTGVVIHTDTLPNGEFASSNAQINQLQHNIVWGQKGNFVDVPTDCPQRDERLGWTGDAQVFVRTASFNMDIASFFARWTRDLADVQLPQGSYPAVAPIPRRAQEEPGTPWIDGGPAWADAGIICPWTIWQRYGDTQVLSDRYASMQRFIAYLESSSVDLIRCAPETPGFHGFGDWLALDDSGKTEGRTPRELIGTAFFAHDAHLMSEIAAALGKTADARRYQRLAERVRSAFQARFVTADGLMAGQTQTAYVLALHFDLLPSGTRQRAVAELVRDIRRRGTHLATGFVGTPYLLHVLTEAGELDLAYELLHQQSWPSWLYSVTQGATTIWERWDGWTQERGFQDPGMNSFNHYAYGAVGDWLYAAVAGLDMAPGSAGYKRLLLRPRLGGGFTAARARYETPYGDALSDWRLVDGELFWEVIVPANSSATIHVPCHEGAEVLEGDEPAEQAEGVVARGWRSGAAIFDVGAGHYEFRTRPQ